MIVYHSVSLWTWCLLLPSGTCSSSCSILHCTCLLMHLTQIHIRVRLPSVLGQVVYAVQFTRVHSEFVVQTFLKGFVVFYVKFSTNESFFLWSVFPWMQHMILCMIQWIGCHSTTLFSPKWRASWTDFLLLMDFRFAIITLTAAPCKTPGFLFIVAKCALLC